MIIKSIKETLGQMFNSPDEATTDSVEDTMVVDEQIEVNESDAYVGVPAPVYLEDDPWFGPSPTKSEKQMDYMEKETEMKKQEEEKRKEYNGEPCNMHQLMYEMATSNWNTVQESQGGSENFQGGSENVHR